MTGVELYGLMGGTAGCRRLSEAFYARVARDPILRPFFPGKTMTCAIEEFTAFLVQFLGGPAEDTQRRWWLSLHESHRRFKIGPREREAWMRNMAEALNEAQPDEGVRATLREFFERSSSYVIDREPPASGPQTELDARWERQRGIDQAVAAIRKGDADLAITLAKRCSGLDRAVEAHLLALMIVSGRNSMVDYAHRKIIDDPQLARTRYNGKTLLHTVSAAGNLTMVKLLLDLGVDPNEKDDGGHAPLYSVGNQCQTEGCESVVRALVAAGADVNANGGVKRCTALHMAARRGNVEVAQALLECGANIEAPDSRGDTPLGRAVKCRKSEVAELFLERGARPVKARERSGAAPA